MPKPKIQAKEETIQSHLQKCIDVLQIESKKRTQEQYSILREWMSNTYFFQKLKVQSNEEVVDLCLKSLKYEKCQQNEVLFHAGDLAKQFYIIIHGSVSVLITLPSVEDPNQFEYKEVNTLHSGASFGELGLSGDNVKRTATIVGKTDCVFATLAKNDYKKLSGDSLTIQNTQKINFLSKFPFFDGWHFREVKTISYHFEEQKWSINSKVYSQGDPTDYIYFIRDGEFEILNRSEKIHSKQGSTENLLILPSGLTTQTICILGPEQLFGEETFLINNSNFSLKIPEVYNKKIQINKNQENLQWSKRLFTVICKSKLGITYRISRQDIQKRFWDHKTQSEFLQLIGVVFEWKQKRLKFLQSLQKIEEKPPTKLRSLINSNQILDENLYPQKNCYINSKDRVDLNKNEKLYIKVLNRFTNIGQTSKKTHRNTKEENSSANSRLEIEYKNARMSESNAFKQFQKLFQDRNFSYSQVKNFFDQKNFSEQKYIDKQSYRKLLFRFLGKRAKQNSERPVSFVKKVHIENPRTSNTSPSSQRRPQRQSIKSDYTKPTEVFYNEQKILSNDSEMVRSQLLSTRTRTFITNLRPSSQRTRLSPSNDNSITRRHATNGNIMIQSFLNTSSSRNPQLSYIRVNTLISRREQFQRANQTLGL